MKFLKFIVENKKDIKKFIFAPLISGLLLCYVYSGIFVQHIPFGIVDMDRSSLSRTIIQQLKLSPGLNINYYTDSEEKFEQAIKEKKINGGIIIPKNYYKDFNQKRSPRVALWIDETNMLIGSNVLGYASVVLSTINAGTEIKIFEGKSMQPYSAKQAISSFSNVERILYEPQQSFMRYLIYILLPYTLQLSFLGKFLVPTLIDERNKLGSVGINSKQAIKDARNLFARILLVITVCIISVYFVLCILRKYYAVPLRGNILEYIAVMFIFMLNLTAMGFFFASFIDDTVHFMQFFGTINLVTMLSSTATWPEYMMPSVFAQVVKRIWPLTYVALPMRAINLKGVGWDVILPYIRGGLLYSLFWLPVGIGLYSARIVLKKHKNKKSFIAENVA